MAVEPPLFPALAATASARAAYARSVRYDSDDKDEREETARNAANDLKAALRTFDRNRSKVAGDRPTPRKARAAAAPAPNSDAMLLEMQSLRRGVLALVEVGKAVRIPSFLSAYVAHANTKRSSSATSTLATRPSTPLTRCWVRTLRRVPSGTQTTRRRSARAPLARSR